MIFTRSDPFPQTRGSIPFFWSQRPNLKYKPKPQISKSGNHVSCYTFLYIYICTCVYIDINFQCRSICKTVLLFSLSATAGWFSETFRLADHNLRPTSHFKPGAYFTSRPASNLPAVSCFLQITGYDVLIYARVSRRLIRKVLRNLSSSPSPRWWRVSATA